MQYRNDKNGVPLSVLGYGCMRFTRKGTGIDIDKAEGEIMRAYELGVNYYDTAYIYPGSEAALGKILAKNGIREKVYIATKLPHYLIKSIDGIERMFTEQLNRLQTDYIDYYLMHMLTDTATWDKLVSLGILDWIAEKKASGRIRNIGFSFHGGSDMFVRLVDAYDWDFCQIQYNYMDEYSQAGRTGLRYAAAKNMPVIIMEPLRGGRLVNMLPEKARELIKETGGTPASVALRWLWTQPEVTVILSGMNSVSMVEENCETASSALPGTMTDSELSVIEQVKSEINRSLKVGCTGCGYCMPCPQGVDIPGTFSCYNKIYTESRSGARKEYLQCTAFRKDPSSASLCIECGKCELHCPQHLEIRKHLKDAAKELENISYKVARFGIRLFKMW